MESNFEKVFPYKQHNGKKNCAEGVEHQVDNTCALAVCGRAYGAQQCRYAGAYVTAHNDEKYAVAAVADGDSCRGDRDDDTGDRAAALEEGGYGSADKKEQDGVGNAGDSCLEKRIVLKDFHTAFHHPHAYENKSETAESEAERLKFFAFGKQIHKRAHAGEEHEITHDIDTLQSGDLSRYR